MIVRNFWKENILHIAIITAATASAIVINPASYQNLTISDGYKPIHKANSRVLQGEPPYYGTIFVEPQIVTSEDSTSYLSNQYIGTAMRTIYDRRKGWSNVEVYLYEVTYQRGVKIEFSVHNEFAQDKAATPVNFYAPHVGRLPMVVLKKLSQVWIMKGVESWGGGKNPDGIGHILIHTGQGDLYENDGIIEETLIHEGAHAALDNFFYGEAWYAAAEKDANYISDYARDNPNREDLAETFVLYLAAEYTLGRLSEEDLEIVVTTIPNRIEYLNSLDLDMYPYTRINDQPTITASPTATASAAYPYAFPTTYPSSSYRTIGTSHPSGVPTKDAAILTAASNDMTTPTVSPKSASLLPTRPHVAIPQNDTVGVNETPITPSIAPSRSSVQADFNPDENPKSACKVHPIGTIFVLIVSLQVVQVGNL